MPNSLLILGIGVGTAILIMLGINLYLLIQSRKTKPDESQLVLHQRIDALSQALNEQLERNRQASESSVLTVSKLLSDELEKHRQSTERTTLAVSQQVQSFTQGMTQLHENVKQMHDSVKGISSFQDIFKSPKLRGQWGESSLEATLNNYFPRDRYSLQHYFSSGEAVDCALKLPNGLLLPIDSKFNWENFQKMVNADNEIHKSEFRTSFYNDVKKKVDEIASKYILPSEGTTDMALMYVPAESVYYEIVCNFKDIDIPQYALKKKVILVSPNTLFLSISSIQHWLKDVQFHQQTKSIMKRLDRIMADGAKLADDFRKLGKHISDAKSSYDDSEKRLSLMVDRVKTVIELSEEEEVKQIEVPKV
ncbi:MAG TPA: DNA recombination protein RmuC [Candidatus Paceibacterota bacterium]